MGKKAKEHRKKVANRNQKIKDQQRISQKYYTDLMEQIRAERESGKFENNETFDSVIGTDEAPML